MSPDTWVDGPNRPLTFIYASAPNRGLEEVLRVWSYVYAQLGGSQSGAVLEVYYGFTPGFEKQNRGTMRDYDEWKARMEQLLAQEGVVYVGFVDAARLAAAYAGAGFALYPTAFPETSCIAMMKAMVPSPSLCCGGVCQPCTDSVVCMQAMGAIPITSRFRSSALPELTPPWDLGPRTPRPGPGTPRHVQEQWLREYADHVVAAASGSLPVDELVAEARAAAAPLEAHRRAMKAWARTTLTWDAVAKQWARSLFDSAGSSTSSTKQL